MVVDTLIVMIIVATVCLPAGIVVFMFKDKFLSLLRKSPKVKTFRWCMYMGGTVLARQRGSSLLRIVVRRDTIDFGGFGWQGKELEILRSHLDGVRRLEGPQTSALDNIELGSAFERLAQISVKKGVFWNWVLLSWQGGNAAVMFNSGKKAAEFMRLIQEDAANEGDTPAC